MLPLTAAVCLRWRVILFHVYGRALCTAARHKSVIAREALARYDTVRCHAAAARQRNHIRIEDVLPRGAPASHNAQYHVDICRARDVRPAADGDAAVMLVLPIADDIIIFSPEYADARRSAARSGGFSVCATLLCYAHAAQRLCARAAAKRRISHARCRQRVLAER